MKNLIKFSIVMVVLCITACTQTFENTSNEVQKKAQGRLVMKVGNESRTIKPTIGESDVKTAVLTANNKEIKSWSGENIISQIENTEDILLDVVGLFVEELLLLLGVFPDDELLSDVPSTTDSLSVEVVSSVEELSFSSSSFEEIRNSDYNERVKKYIVLENY